jgi:hypothetical protein
MGGIYVTKFVPRKALTDKLPTRTRGHAYAHINIHQLSSHQINLPRSINVSDHYSVGRALQAVIIRIDNVVIDVR